MSEWYIGYGSSGEIIMHHGVKGQKWGVIRRAYQKVGNGVRVIGNHAKVSLSNRIAASRAVRAGKKLSKLEKKRSTKYALRNEVKTLSDEELAKKVTRLELERRYVQARNDVLEKTKPQQTIGEKCMSKLGEIAAKKLTDVATDKVMSLGQKKTDKEKFEDLKVEANTMKYKHMIEEYKKGNY